MMQSFNFRPSADSPCYKINLFSLAEYEREGGRYSDAGNGGEDMTEEAARGEFVCAASVEDTHDDGMETDKVLDAAGCGEVWLDSCTGFWLLRQFPDAAPLEARMLN